MFSKKKEKPAFDPADYIDSLKAVLPERDFDVGNLSVPLGCDKEGKVRPIVRHKILLSDGQRVVDWENPSLRTLFRGDRTPPDLSQYPAEYVFSFHFIESHLLTLCEAMGPRRDKEMEEVYSALRRRPDGSSLGLVHDFIWQVVALWLGMRPTSQAEFEAVLLRLERSCRSFQMGPASRNYIEYLRQKIGQS